MMAPSLIFCQFLKVPVMMHVNTQFSILFATASLCSRNYVSADWLTSALSISTAVFRYCSQQLLYLFSKLRISISPRFPVMMAPLSIFCQFLKVPVMMAHFRYFAISPRYSDRVCWRNFAISTFPHGTQS